MYFAAIILNLFSSYLIASSVKNILVIFVSFFAFVIFNMEVLSLFDAISQGGIIIVSLFNLIFSFLFFKLRKAELLKINIDFKRIKNSLLLDKILIFLCIAFGVMLLVTLFLAVVIPVLEPDGQTYHFLRAYNFIKFKSLNHFETNDIRALVMPINSEIIYAWMYLFKKTLYGYGMLSYCSFIFYILALWQVLDKFKFCFRKRLFAIFIFSSFSSVIIQIPSLQTDVVVGSLLMISFCLFIKSNTRMLLYFSSLALSVAMGVKSTGIMSLLGFFILLILIEKQTNKKTDIKKFIFFCTCLIVNFIVFSSYNYINNFIHFHNFLSNNCALVGHAFWGGFKGYIANVVHFCFQSLDFTGFKWGYYLNTKILALKDLCFNLMNIPMELGCNYEQEKINIITDEQIVGFGILGFLVYIPMLIKSIIAPLYGKTKKSAVLFSFALVFIVNILVLSGALAYLVFSIRFIIAFVCLSAPILVYSYKKKGIYKNLIVFFCFFYMFFLPFCIKRMPFWKAFYMLKSRGYNIEQFAFDCYENKYVPVYPSSFIIYHTILQRYPDKKNIAIVKTLESSLLYLTVLENKNRRIDFLAAGLINKEKLKSYDLVILERESQKDNIFNPEDINIRYIENGNNITFKDNKELNCFYRYQKKGEEEIKKQDATERVCFTHYYFKNLDYLKLDFTEIINQPEEISENGNSIFKIYYYVNQIKD